MVDLKSRYQYSYGAPAQLKKGDLDNMPNAGALKELDISRRQTQLIEPRFIGVYQYKDIVPHGKKERRRRNEIKEAKELLDKLVNTSANSVLLSALGAPDKVNPKLIHIGYDSEIWTPELVRQAFDGLKRVALSPLNGMPDFYEKNTTELYLILDRGLEIFEEIQDGREVMKRLSPDIDSLAQQLITYGLTREEYAFLQIMRKLGRGGTETRLASDPAFIRIASEFLNMEDSP